MRIVRAYQPDDVEVYYFKVTIEGPFSIGELPVKKYVKTLILDWETDQKEASQLDAIKEVSK